MKSKKFLKSSAPFFIPALLILALNLAVRRIPGFGEWYAVTIYPFFVNTISRFCSLFPFSVVEIGLYGAILTVFFPLIRGIWRLIKGRITARDLGTQCRRGCGRLLFAAELLLLIYTLTCGINYHRTPFSELAGWEIRPSSAEELTGLCRALADELIRLDPQIPRDADGCAVLPEDAPALASAAMTHLGETYPALAGYFPRPKLLLVPEILSCQQLSGVYSPFTVEANVNGDMTAYNLAPVMCHELSHLKGFMREDEANFIACLACTGSDDAAFQYGGTLFAYIYASNALYGEDADAWQTIRGTLPAGVLTDLRANSAFWARYESPISEAADKINDTYLKLNDQTDGVKSYGRMVDLLLAAYRLRSPATVR